jgi:hypothetical protein
VIRNRWTALLSFAAVFLSGIVVGVFGHSVYEVKTVSATLQPPPSPEQWRKQYLTDLSERLQLNADQVSKVDMILIEAGAKVKAVKDRYKPEMKAIYHEQVRQIDLLLDDKQKSEYALFREERKKRMKEWEKKNGGK